MGGSIAENLNGVGTLRFGQLDNWNVSSCTLISAEKNPQDLSLKVIVYYVIDEQLHFHLNLLDIG